MATTPYFSTKIPQSVKDEYAPYGLNRSEVDAAVEKVIMEKLLRRLNNSRRLENDVERTKEDGWLALWSSF